MPTPIERGDGSDEASLYLFSKGGSLKRSALLLPTPRGKSFLSKVNKATFRIESRGLALLHYSQG